MLEGWRRLWTSQKKKEFEVQWVLECKNQTQIFLEAAWSFKKLDLVMCFSNMKAKKKKWWKSLNFLKKSLNPKIRIGLKKSLFDYGSQTILKLDFMFGSNYLHCHNQGVVQT
jgi:hypothetical protein